MDSDLKKLETAVILARMYGVKETLEPLPFMANEKFAVMITGWAEEYLNREGGDIVDYFEDRVRTHRT